ncbi:RluA family pseudouridine synthase [Caviibacter abscessus]|uniref:RluA family pseudouridine synthase n=1 Tax=Caviibacter abscessus TaxID=1766719 RepID=UPI000834E88F|nr:RluA family pseudouridine synthase [Caviibacter abscessus]
MKIKIDKEYENVRLDRYLRKHCKNNSLSEIFSAIRTAKIKVNDKKVSQDYRLKIDDELYITSLEFNLIKKEKKEYNNKYIVYEDENLLIINKPAGMPIHKGSGHSKGLAELYNINFANRLDRKTKGLVIGCKTPSMLRHVTQLIRENKVIKKYEAITKNNGKYAIGDVFHIKNKLYVGEDKVIISDKGKIAESIFKVIDIQKDKIIFEVQLISGRKHQIRVQLSSIGLSIIGDDKYGNYKPEDELMLKCKYLEFDKYKFEI